jgi:5-methyltetrahydrofolate--homocysteine methyltransferase
MVDKETIIDTAERSNADIVAVSGLITPSLYQMEELCREMAARGMTTPLLIGGATTSALHTAIKLAPLYDHVFYGADASAAAVLAKKCMIDRETFESEQHLEQQRLRDLYKQDSNCHAERSEASVKKEAAQDTLRFPLDSYVTEIPADIPVQEIPLDKVLPYFDWRMFYAIWGVKYGSSSPEAMELIQLRRDAEDELAVGDFKIMLGARFFPANTEGDDICFAVDEEEMRLPMMRQEGGKNLSLADFVIPAQSGRKSPFGMFAISVHKKSKAHVHGCSCPACSNAYEDMIGKAVRMTLAEAASLWLDNALLVGSQWTPNECLKTSSFKKIKPAIGYSSCPDHTRKELVLKLLDDRVHHYHTHSEHCGCADTHKHSANYSCSDSESHKGALGIELTESYAMAPEASICGLIFMHPEAEYPQIRCISQNQYDDYVKRRGMDAETALRFLGHLLK